VLTTIGWIVGGFIFAMAIENGYDSAEYVFGFAVSGAVGGFMTGLAVRQYAPRLGWNTVFTITGSWVIGLGLFGLIDEAPVIAIIGVPLGPLGTGLALRWAEASVTWKKVLAIAFGWIICGGGRHPPRGSV